MVVPVEAAVQDLGLSAVHEEIAGKSARSLAKLMMLVCKMPAEQPDNQATKAQFSQWNDSLSEDHCGPFVRDVPRNEP